MKWIKIKIYPLWISGKINFSMIHAVYFDAKLFKTQGLQVKNYKTKS